MSVLPLDAQARIAGPSSITSFTGMVDREWISTGYSIGARHADGEFGCSCGSLAGRVAMSDAGPMFGCYLFIEHGCINHEAITTAREVVLRTVQLNKARDSFTMGGRQ